MGIKLIDFDKKIRPMVIEVMKNARCQRYTPERLADLQNILDAKHFYYWSMDMKKEEYLCDLMTEDFTYRCFVEKKTAPKDQALRSKYVNKSMTTMHMCHQPLVWFMDEDHARGIFQYEDHNTYKDGMTVEGFSVYCDDFRRCEDGLFRISTMRLAYKKMNGQLRDVDVPEGWEPKRWEEWKAEREMV
ncbi:MAG: nuclear transport factor 2 family protein [Hespellia sp.]|nr:nuclear transport factor 2 family protein [Hespellia sp.]